MSDIMSEEKGIGTGFWVEGFGTIDIHYYADGERLYLDEHKKQYIEKQAIRTIRRLFNILTENTDD